MKNQILSQYLHLIQALLNCPEGEEWNLLHQHEELVNPDFINLMEQVAQQLNSNGNLEAARFLSYWIEQLNHVFLSPEHTSDNDNETQTYLNLIQTLLDCPDGQEVEVLAANKSLVNSRFVYVMRQVGKQMLERGERETAIYLINLAAEVSQLLSQQAQVVKPKFPPNYQLNQPQKASNYNQNYQNQPAIAFNHLPLQSNPQSSESTFLNATTQSDDILTEQPSGETSCLSTLDEKLNYVIQSLERLEKTFNSHLQQSNPLWYMDVLERAQAANWLLSSEEIEQLIGVKPKCEAEHHTFQRGGWIFTKTGKIGSQIAWRVSKYVDISG